jgi:hypothetical protein
MATKKKKKKKAQKITRGPNGETQYNWRALADSYRQQLDAIGAALVRARVITPTQIAQHGIQFAILRRFEETTQYQRRSATIAKGTMLK